MRGEASDEKFHKKEHLLKSREFAKVYKRGASGRLDGIVFYCMPNGLKYNRLGFSIGSKNVKNATSRNRIRRLFKEVYRKLKRYMRTGFDIVMVVKKDLHATLTYGSAEAIFRRLTKNANIMI